MKTKSSKKLSSFILCMVLIVAMALSTTGCNGSDSGSVSSADTVQETSVQADDSTQVDDSVQADDSTQADDAAQADTASQAGNSTQLGEGSTEFAFTVVDKEGNETAFTIHTDKETVGEALLELGLIEGDESEYGLYVKTVNGITADYDADGVYWAFYVNDEYAQTGVDSTTITAGDSYTFKVE